MRAWRRLGVLVIAGTLAAGTVTAEVLRVEAVGSVPLAAGVNGGASARQAALEAGVREAVQRTALDLAAQAGSAAPSEAVVGALGQDPLPYATGYRILEDRGERDPLLETSPAAASEYLVTVSVDVDAAKIRRRLLDAGLLGAPAGVSKRGIRITLEGIDSYPLWERIQRGLAARGGAVRPLEFTRGRVLAEIETDEAPGDLVKRLGTVLGDEVGVRSVGMDAGGIVVAIGPAAPPLAGPEASAPETTGHPPLSGPSPR